MTQLLPVYDPIAVFDHDATEIIGARERAKFAHGIKNVRSAGDEAELKIREILQKRLVPAVRVTHGHIVDNELRVSSQLDIIVADNTHFPILNVLQDKSEHILFDSVYAVGEIKTLYKHTSLAGPIEIFSKQIRFIKENLQREPSTYTGKLGVLAGRRITITSNNPDPYNNPLFLFMIIVNSDQLRLDSLRQFYMMTPRKYLPNIVCMLDRGVIVYCLSNNTEEGLELLQIDTTPEFVDYRTDDNKQLYGVNILNGWSLLSFGKEERPRGVRLMMLHLILISFMRRHFLRKGDISSNLLSKLAYDGSVMF